MRAWRALALAWATACGVGPAVAPAPLTSGYLVYVRDREGSVLAAIDDRGKTISTSADDAFGLTLSSTGTSVPREFLDQDRDDETGYYHFRRRYYDPATAQWISPDPKLIENPDCSDRVQGCNPYAFAGNRPLEWTDSDGREVTAFIDSSGRQGLFITAGFYGPQANQAQQMFNEAMLKFNGPLRIVATTAVYKTAAEIPVGITPIEADLAHIQAGSNPPYHGSDSTQSNSVTHLGADALAADDPHWPYIIQHEVLHLAGLPERYHQEGKIQVNDSDAVRGSVMALIYDTAAPRLLSLDLNQIAHPPAQSNQGMDSSAPDFGPGANVLSIDTHAP
jgi:RHS repeat-associated protein